MRDPSALHVTSLVTYWYVRAEVRHTHLQIEFDRAWLLLTQLTLRLGHRTRRLVERYTQTMSQPWAREDRADAASSHLRLWNQEGRPLGNLPELRTLSKSLGRSNCGLGL